MLSYVTNKFESYHFYAFISAFSGSLFYLITTYIYGATSVTDNLFVLLTVCTYSSIIPQLIWGGFVRTYVDSDHENKINIDNFILITTAIITLVLIISVIIIYNLNLSNNMAHISPINMVFLAPIFIFIEALKKISIGRGKLNNAFIADSILWSSSSAIILIFRNKTNPITAIFIAAFISLSILALTTKIKFRHVNITTTFFKAIIKESAILKCGAVIYLFKDFIVPIILIFGKDGSVTIFSFANKFHSALMSIVIFSSLEKVGNVSTFKYSYKSFNVFLANTIKKNLKLLLAIQVFIIVIWYILLLLMPNIKQIYSDSFTYYIMLTPIFWIQAFESTQNKFITMHGGANGILSASIVCMLFYIIFYFYFSTYTYSIYKLLLFISITHILITTIYALIINGFKNENSY